MSLYVFISSTGKDLQKECRPAVRRALEGEAVEVAMESWTEGFKPSLEGCRKKVVEDSTHYLGIFAYRRGWEPDGCGGKSITELEFDWAVEHQKELAIFMPNPDPTHFDPTHPDKPLDQRLRDLASDQTAEEAAAQEKFCNRVKSLAFVQLFEDVSHLEGRVGKQVMLWVNGGTRAAAAQATRTPSAVTQATPRFKGAGLNDLGHRSQLAAFDEVLAKLATQSLPEVACFLLHGPDGYGHSKAVAKLRRGLEVNNQDVKRILVDIDPGLQGNDLAALLRAIGGQLSQGFAPATVGELAIRLQEKLKQTDVILEFTNLHRFTDSLPGFVAAFWNPLVSWYKQAPPHRLIGLISFEGRLEKDWPAIFCYAQKLGKKLQGYAPTSLIVLPRLTAFDEQDLVIWLRAQGFEKDQAQRWAGTLIKETKGIPDKLYRRLEGT